MTRPRILFTAVSNFVCAGRTQGLGLVGLQPAPGTGMKSFGFCASPELLRQMGKALVRFADELERVKEGAA